MIFVFILILILIWWMDGWMDGWIDVYIYINIYICVCVCNVCVLHRLWLYHTSARCMAQELGHLYVHDFTLHRVSYRFVLIWVCLEIGYPQIPWFTTISIHAPHWDGHWAIGGLPIFRHIYVHICTYIYIIWTYLKSRTWACPNLLLLAAGRT